MRRLPSLNWLRVFEAAARLGSFARAGRMLNMSAPAVSQQIQALETHLGKKLFKRGARHVELTEAGRAFLPVVAQAIVSVETTAAALFGSSDAETITLRTVPLLAMSWLPGVVEAFEAAHPEARVNIIADNGGGHAAERRALDEPDLTIGFGSRSDFPEGAVFMMSERIWPVAAPEVARRIAEEGPGVEPRLLEIGVHHASWRHLAALWPALDFDRAQLRMVDNTPLAFMMAARGLGLALQRAPAGAAMAEAVGLARVAGAPELDGVQQYYVLRADERRRRRSVDRLRDWLVASAAPGQGV